jgi:hypothetical protein
VGQEDLVADVVPVVQQELPDPELHQEHKLVSVAVAEIQAIT